MQPHAAPPDQDAAQPPGFVQRNPSGVLLDYENPATEEGRLKRALLGTDSVRGLVAAVGASSGLVAAHGMGGVGKTCALRGLGRLPDVRRRFPGGIFFLELGEDASVSDVLRMLSKVMRARGNDEYAKKIATCGTVKDAVDIVVTALSDVKCLFLIDSVWSTTSHTGGHLQDLRHLVDSNVQSRIVFSTRDKKIADYAGAHVSFGTHSEATSRRMLLKYAGFTQEEADSMPADAAESLQRTLNDYGALPITVAVVGRLVERQARRLPKHRPKSDAWVRYMMFAPKVSDDAHHPGLLEAMLQGLDEVETQLRGAGYPQCSAAEKYWSLCVLQKPSWTPVYDLCDLWGVDVGLATLLVEEFESLALLNTEERDFSGTMVIGVRLHDLAHDFCEQQAKERGGERLVKAMNAYRRKMVDRAVEAALAHGTAKLLSVRVLVMGGSRRGKTSTVESLLGRAFKENRASTRGIDLETHCLAPGDRGLAADVVKEKASRVDSFATTVSRISEEAALNAEIALLLASRRSARRETLDPSDAIVHMSQAPGTPRTRASDVDRRVHETARRGLDARVDIKGDNGQILNIWDFGGQKQYEVCHQLFISQRSVLMFAIDLQRFCCEATRKEEFDVLMRWLRCAFALMENPGAQHVVIVGTRKSKCDDIEGAWKILKRMIKKWSKTVYNAWVVKPDPGIGGKAMMQMIALENDGAVDDDKGSGLLELEKHLWSITRQIIDKSVAVPVRWRALLEEMVRAGVDKLFLTTEDIIRIAADFPGFRGTSEGLGLTRTVMEMLRHFRDLGELILFDMSSESCGSSSSQASTSIVFVDPEKLLQVLRDIIGPHESVTECLEAEESTDYEQGLVDVKSLHKLWWKVPESYRSTMVDMLCSFDVLVRLEWHEGGRRMVGIPALMPCLGLDDASFEERMRSGSRAHNEQDLVVYTVFTELFPSGLIGVLVASLHKTVGGERTTVQNFRADAVLLRLNEGELVLVRHVQQSSIGAHVKWWFLGLGPVDIARRCLRQFNALMQAQFRKVSTASYKHLMIADCKKDLGCCIKPQSIPFAPGRGCGSKESVKLEIDSESLRDDDKRRELHFRCSECNQRSCGLVHEHAPLKDRVRGSPAPAGQEPSTMSKPSSKRYDLLVSCNDKEKLTRLGKSAVAPSVEVGDLARTVESQVAAFAAARGRAPSVYLMNTHGDIYDAVMQLRGGGVALFLLTLEFFRNERCLTTLLSCMHYAENGRNGSGLQLRFVCLERDVEDIFKDEIVKSHFPTLKDDYVVLTVEDGTIAEMAHHVAKKIVWEGWTVSQEGEQYAVLGGDIERSFRDLTGLFSNEYFGIAKFVLQVYNRNMESIIDVFVEAMASNRIGFHNVDALREICLDLRAPAATREQIESAVVAYENKWLRAAMWEWGECEKGRLRDLVSRHVSGVLEGGPRDLMG